MQVFYFINQFFQGRGFQYRGPQGVKRIILLGMFGNLVYTECKLNDVVRLLRDGAETNGAD